MIPLKKTEMQGAKFSRNETYLAYVAVSGKLKQRRRLGFFSGINDEIYYCSSEKVSVLQTDFASYHLPNKP
jgi:hypothetical protein